MNYDGAQRAGCLRGSKTGTWVDPRVRNGAHDGHALSLDLARTSGEPGVDHVHAENLVRLVGAALRRYRETLGFALEDAAAILECDRSKVSRIETDQRGIRVKELRELLTAYVVPESDQDTLAALASPRRAGWWQQFGDAVPEAAPEWLFLESLATCLAIYDTQIPELLQTSAYATATAPPGLAPDRYTEAILARQNAITGDRRPEVSVILPEHALGCRTVTPEVMRGQLTRLAAVAATVPHVAIQILPAASWASTLTRAPVTITSLGGPGLGAVHLPGPGGGIWLTDPADITHFTRAFTAITRDALPAPASSRLLAGWAERPADPDGPAGVG